MKISSLLILLTTLQLTAVTYSQTARVSMKIVNGTIADVFREIENQSDYTIFYKDNQLDVSTRLSLTADNLALNQVLSETLRATNSTFKVLDKIIVIAPTESLQEKNVTGKVTDTNGIPLPGVSIVVKGTTIGTITDLEGVFTLTIPQNYNVLSFSFMGMKTQEVIIEEVSELNVVMEEEIIGIDELVVVGYGTQRRVNLTGSVTIVNTEEITRIPVPTISQGIMGRSAGVFIKNKQGQPGEVRTDINIRGFGTPLVIVDGMPVTLDYFQQLEPNEIESLNVLKDAASAAVYGARAGNGVILVSTKRGKLAPPEFTFSTNYGMQFITQMQQPVESYQYAQMENVANFNEGKPAKWTDEEIQKLKDGSDPLNYPNTDFVDAVLRQFAPQAQHNINIRGGSDRVKYFTSASYYHQEGMLKSDEVNFDRFSLRSNVDIQLTDKFEVGFDMSFTNQHYLGPRFDMEQKFASESDVNIRTLGIMNRILRSRSYYSIAPYPDPTKAVWGGNTATNNPVNMIYMDKTGFKKRTTLNGYGKLNFSYELPLGFEVKAAFDLNRTYQRFKDKSIKLNEYEYVPETDEYIVRAILNSEAQLFERNSVAENINQQYFLTWDRQFSNHNFSALLVHERLADNYDVYWASRRDYEFPLNYLFAGPDANKDNSGYGTEGARLAFVGRVTYNYMGKYLLEVNSRWDASPNFPPDTRWGVFPSASMAWRISEEDFFKDNLPFINNFKIRGSYGNLGYDRTGDFQYLSTYSITSGYIFDGNTLMPSINEDALPNPLITWEKMTSSNFGVDFHLFDYTLEGSFDYFYRKRTDVLGQRQVSLPNVVGVQMPRENFMEYDNRGGEAMLNYTKKLSEATFNIGGNISWNREKTIVRDEPVYSNKEAWRRGTQIGQWTDTWWMLPTDGLFKTQEEIDTWADIDGQGNRSIKPGDVKFVDYNEDGRITNEDMIVAGRGVFPRLFYGMQLSIKWKGLDMSMLWQGAGFYNFNLRHSTGYLSIPFYSGISPQTFMYEEYYTPENPWIPTNTNARWPIYRYDRTNRTHRSYGASQHWLINGSYIRLKNIELGYTIPSDLTKRVGIKNFRIYLSGYNVLTFSELSNYLDPEIDTQPSTQFGDYHPPLGMYNIGALINF